ncbi:MAG: hypothetical protein HGGPFJEG_01215 [Ignavibacteria bacterium]|nr:hypothetical protein [Ignavibacteria bacterium]
MLSSQCLHAQLGSYAGAFSRMGFSARGLAMSNSGVSDIFGDISGIYNPALSTFQEDGKVDLGYTFLNLDRRLNFLGFTKKFKLPKQEKGGAGITLAWINAGVSDIDGRDNDTRQIGMFSTFENEFYFGTGFKLSDMISIGVGFKLYYAKLFEEVTTTSFALDFGGIYKANENLAIGITLKDIGAKYEWQTSQLYGSNGNTTEDKFPVLLDIGAAYNLKKHNMIVSLALQQYFTKTESDFENSTGENSNNTIVKFGVEKLIIGQFKLRAGIDRMDLSSDDFFGNIKPSAGFGISKNFSKSINLGVDYSFQLEPYTHNPIQNIGIVFKFK